MPREIETKVKWLESSDGVICRAIAIDKRTHRILSQVNANIPFETMDAFLKYYDEPGKKEIEKTSENLAKSIAEKSPE